MFSVGLTGGLGSGKSTVSRYFAELGVTIIDADTIAHQLTALNRPAFKAIIDHYGPGILLANGELDRKKLGHVIFHECQEKKWLEALLHPMIQIEIKQQVSNVHAPYCMVVIPLLVESGAYTWINRILVVDCPEFMQIERAKARDQLSEAQIIAILQQQATRSARLACADDVIHNIEGVEALDIQVRELHNRYTTLATMTG
jgi:dephospho-CoA kinase